MCKIPYMHDFPDYPCPICSPKEFEAYKANKKVQCQKCLNIYTGMGDSFCPECEGILVDIIQDNSKIRMNPTTDWVEKDKCCMGGCGNINCKHCHSPVLEEEKMKKWEANTLPVKGFTPQEPIEENNCICKQTLRTTTKNETTYCDDCGGKAIYYQMGQSTQEPMEWANEFDKEFVREDGLMDKYAYDKDGDSVFMATAIKSFIKSQIKQAEERGQREERQFILNILDGVDKADKEMERQGIPAYGGTKAIRFALSSRIINQNNE